ncbi:MAG TPA: hypothetical protein VGM14_05320 [Streptosporangiaceae bacterium]|jgi:hypothetical protein
MASFEQWLGAFRLAYGEPGRVSALSCPNCGAQDLQLRFVLYGSRGQDANAVFWCGNCLQGMPPGPSQVPDSCTPVRAEDAGIPNYRLVPPTGRSERALP